MVTRSALIFAFFAAACILPSQSFLLADVPYHRQITIWACGDASAEMVLHYESADVDQRAIIDVQRSTSEEGTLSYDIVRAFHFSSLSKSPIEGAYPAQSPRAGFDHLPVGKAGFGLRSDDLSVANGRTDACWVDKLAAGVESGWPAVVLQHYALDDAGGHFRVVIGAERSAAGSVTSVTLLDPWDRSNGGTSSSLKRPFHKARQIKSSSSSGKSSSSSLPLDNATQPRMITLSRADFCDLWNYNESNVNVTYAPYFAAFGRSWDIQVGIFAGVHSGYDVVATVTYSYPKIGAVLPVHRGLVADKSSAVLSLPVWMHIDSSHELEVEIGSLAPDQSWTHKWHVELAEGSDVRTTFGSLDSVISVSASGVISSSVPWTYSGPNSDPYPSYRYGEMLLSVVLYYSLLDMACVPLLLVACFVLLTLVYLFLRFICGCVSEATVIESVGLELPE